MPRQHEKCHYQRHTKPDHANNAECDREGVKMGSKTNDKLAVTANIQIDGAEFTKRLPTFEKLRDEAMFILNKKLAPSDIRIHSTTSRIKTFESFAEKVERNQYQVPYSQ
ncbi:MAG TPA: hypothetical protein VK720_00905, partial [Terracidiphilus sp.]|nr:hypothetical protein [Terracidiphilus sp.]